MIMHTLTKKLVALGVVGLMAAAWTTAPAVAGTTMASGKDVKAVEEPEAEPWWSAELSAGWDSLYMFRGADILGDNSLAWTQLKFSAFGITTGVWYAVAVDGNNGYEELDAFISYSHSFGPVSLEVGYIYYLFSQLDDSTHEVYGGISYTGIPYVTPSLYYYHDLDLFDGGYLEFKVKGSIPLVKDVLTLEPWALVSAGDYNDLVDSDWGWNNVGAGVALVVALNEHIKVTGYGAYSHSLDVIEDNLLADDDEWWGGASISFSF